MQRARPDAPHRWSIDALASEPWRNGAGLTRLLAAEHDAHGLLWRISIADLAREAPFSAFDAIDRHAVLLSGAGLTLVDAHPAGAGQPAPAPIHFDAIGAIRAFAGEAALQACLGDVPARLFNVMTRRGAWRADLQVHTCTAPGPGRPVGTATPPQLEVLLVLDGSLLVCQPGGVFSLGAGHGLWQRGGFDATLGWQAADAATRWLHLRLAPCADPATPT
ncbi:MAG: HutD family protein [Leptothrix sp. (in: b-proteobacteria)]